MKSTKFYIFLLASLSFIIFSSCEMNFISSQPQTISDSIEIGKDWKEIVPSAPLKSKTSVQYVALKMPESVWRDANWDENDPKRQTLKYGDGRSGKIEAILFDDKGGSYELQINAKGGGFNLGRNPKELTKNEPDFPTDRVYTKLKIRSDVPLNLEKIEWAGYNPK